MSSLEEVLVQVDEFNWPKRAAGATKAAHDSTDSDRSIRERGLHELTIHVADQDVVGSLTARAFPLLMDLAVHADNPGGALMLHWLTDLALDGHAQWLTMGCDFDVDSDKFAGAGFKHFRKCQQAVIASRENLIARLSHDDEDVRMVAAYTLTWIAGHQSSVSETVRRTLEVEAVPKVQASLCLCLGLLRRAEPSDTNKDVKLLELHLNGGDENVTLSAA